MEVLLIALGAIMMETSIEVQENYKPHIKENYLDRFIAGAMLIILMLITYSL